LFGLVIVLFSVFTAFVVKERKRSDKLLLNILPVKVAKELKEKGFAAANNFDNVTVLFTDFVNFTSLAETMDPNELVEELHTCFKTFDGIVSKYGIEKIKTVGDAYIAVAGLPVADPDHAVKMISAALEIAAFVAHRKAQLGDRTFDVRVGINSGSVVAGIVGVMKFAYDIWGDTVNTAARMEQSSLPGKINISQSTYELVKDKFECVYRGEQEAKNKGVLAMYFVVKEKV
jgi:adenylate cyclase